MAQMKGDLVEEAHCADAGSSGVYAIPESPSLITISNKKNSLLNRMR